MAPGANRPRVVSGDGNSGLDDDGSWGAMYSSRIMVAYEKMGSSCTTSYPYPFPFFARINFRTSSSSSSSYSSSESDPSTQLESLSSCPWSLLRKGLREREYRRGADDCCSCGSCNCSLPSSCCITSGSENSMDREDGMYGLSPLNDRPSRCWRVFAIAVTAAIRVCSEDIPLLLLLLLLRSDRREYGRYDWRDDRPPTPKEDSMLALREDSCEDEDAQNTLVDGVAMVEKG